FGILIVTLIYLGPVLGLTSVGVVSVWGLGGAVTAALWGLKKEIPDKRVPAPGALPPGSPSTGIPGTPVSPVAGVSLETSTGTAAAAPGAANLSFVPPIAPGAALQANVPEAYAYPRAGFWERMAAAFL